MSQFCRHNRFVAECPICSKGTVLDPNRQAGAAAAAELHAAAAGRSARSRPRPARACREARSRPPGPYEDGREVRLEKVPGGLRLAAWHGGQLVKDAPVMALGDLPAMLRSAADQGLVGRGRARAGRRAGGRARTAPAPAARASSATSCAWSGSTTERVRIARWIMRPNRGWELQEAPVLLPADRFAGALGAAAECGVLSSGDPVE